MTNDKRLIEDYLPIVAISAEASREKSVRKGHISTLHLWWARRPLVACRAAVYGALVPASRFVPNAGSDEKKKSLGRANAAKFVERLCQYPGNPAVIAEAQQHILEAHAQRLTEETGKKVTVEDIVAGKAPRPKVLDMFAGGGAIPLEALRLGCDAYALDLNPVAHIIQLCTLVYPQKYGKPDPTALGLTGPKNAKGETTWGGLAEEVGYWGEWVLKKAKAEIGDLYPPIPDPEAKPAKGRNGEDAFEEPQATMGFAADPQQRLKPKAGHLLPVAYLWTRTVTCKNPNCKATVPLVRQTWLCKKDKHYAALKIIAPRGRKQVRFEVAEATSEKELGFNPAGFSKAGNATCPFCGTVADSDYVKAEGCAGRLTTQFMAVACSRPAQQSKVYLAADDVPDAVPDERAIHRRIQKLCERTGLSLPDEPIVNDAKGALFCVLYGQTSWKDIFSARQLMCLLTFVDMVRQAEQQMQETGCDKHRRTAVATSLGMLVDRLAVYSSTQCVWHYQKGERTAKTFGRQALPMSWDFSEACPFNKENASWPVALEWIVPGLDGVNVGREATVHRGTATAMPWSEQTFDAVITDPPYYDNVPYADIADFFYVWLKRTVGHLYPEHFAATGTPKKGEAVADATRHGGDKDKAKRAYEGMMAGSFAEASRVLKPGGQLGVVYAHKTTLGWATLVDALRDTGFVVSEAWPMDTETLGRLRAQDSAALASSIFLVARKREGAEPGNYEEAVKPELEQIVRERVATLWAMGISGADLVIACVGAGLRAFTRFARVEYANGEEVPAERFLTEVETVVLETILERLSKEVGGKNGQTTLAGMDAATRFYVLWRYTYGAADLDAGEAIIFANGTHVELDGHNGLASGSNAVLEKKKSKYRLRDYTDRGNDDGLGSPDNTGTTRPVVDILHRLLWLLEHRPPKIPEFLADAQPSLEQLRLVCQALAGPALKGSELADISAGAEQSALGKLLANWSAVMEGRQVKADRQKGQDRLL
jgi:putative DNA methylase